MMTAIFFKSFQINTAVNNENTVRRDPVCDHDLLDFVRDGNVIISHVTILER